MNLYKFFFQGDSPSATFAGFTTHPVLWAFDGFTAAATPAATASTGGGNGGWWLLAAAMPQPEPKRKKKRRRRKEEEDEILPSLRLAFVQAAVEARLLECSLALAQEQQADRAARRKRNAAAAFLCH